MAQLVRDQRPLPLAARAAYVVLQPAWAPAIACGITLPLLLPDGRLRSRRWRPMAAAAVAGAVLALVAGSLAPEPSEEALFPNPLALGGAAGRVAAVVAWVGVALFLADLVTAVASVVLRFRAAHGVERQQLRWVAAAATATVAAICVMVPVARSLATARLLSPQTGVISSVRVVAVRDACAASDPLACGLRWSRGSG